MAECCRVWIQCEYCATVRDRLSRWIAILYYSPLHRVYYIRLVENERLALTVISSAKTIMSVNNNTRPCTGTFWHFSLSLEHDVLVPIQYSRNMNLTARHIIFHICTYFIFFLLLFNGRSIVVCYWKTHNFLISKKLTFLRTLKNAISNSDVVHQSWLERRKK